MVNTENGGSRRGFKETGRARLEDVIRDGDRWRDVILTAKNILRVVKARLRRCIVKNILKVENVSIFFLYIYIYINDLWILKIKSRKRENRRGKYNNKKPLS